jgi:hypothetical protein
MATGGSGDHHVGCADDGTLAARRQEAREAQTANLKRGVDGPVRVNLPERDDDNVIPLRPTDTPGRDPYRQDPGPS